MDYFISNSWSDEGISTLRDGDTVECRTTHLTSFAVLVDTQGFVTTSTTAESVGLSIYLVHADYSHFRLFYYQLHWLWFINILFTFDNDCNSILEVTM